MTTEIELKYSLDEAVARELMQQPRLGPFTVGQFSTTEITDIYLDTPNRRLARAGFALRFRRQGEKRVLQVKSLTPATGAWHARRELAIPTDMPTPPTRWPDTSEAAFLREIIGDQPVKPLFTLHQIRHEAPVLDEQGRAFALLSLDEVHWQANERETWAWELEVELLESGDEARLRTLQHTLETWPGLTPQHVSKYERGLKLLTHTEVKRDPRLRSDGGE